jgi:hypothetical protein
MEERSKSGTSSKIWFACKTVDASYLSKVSSEITDKKSEIGSVVQI